MGARYELLKEMGKNQEVVKTEDNKYSIRYNKLIQSGDLKETLWDYNVGFYDVSMSYFQLGGKGLHTCRVYFHTIDDGDFGSWNDFETKEEAIELLEKIIKKFKDIHRCPTQDKLNEMFRNIGVYFCLE